MTILKTDNQETRMKNALKFLRSMRKRELVNVNLFSLLICYVQGINSQGGYKLESIWRLNSDDSTFETDTL